jgi:hypothetical protein
VTDRRLPDEPALLRVFVRRRIQSLTVCVRLVVWLMRFGQRRNPNFGSKFAIENMEIRMAQTRRLAREANPAQDIDLESIWDINRPTDFTFLRLNLS